MYPLPIGWIRGWSPTERTFSSKLLVAEVGCVPATFIYGDSAISGFGVDALEATCGVREGVDWLGIDCMMKGDGLVPTTTRGRWCGCNNNSICYWWGGSMS